MRFEIGLASLSAVSKTIHELTLNGTKLFVRFEPLMDLE